ncbi:DUF3772 domain-containing protein [Sinisalibacter aestuarii]|uniref:Mechanosensitive ion channel protein MscS n=1 Tax=Sinisalibacter aestuarii TaxID=2949426 RepID=A0ABQ5LXX4_9RHOB|nr:DUF3772 domain-containing protein [Sinisalibacter aestuarii]GKY89825.1 mechanosensitive ion channel protein MscS [Sinisalibacter aestuarii]
MRRFSALAALLALLTLTALPSTGRAQEAAGGDGAAVSAAGAESAPEQVLAEEGAAQLAPGSTTSTIDYAAWERVAVRAEQAVEAGRASDQALQNLRSELVGWREVFTRARADNQVRITTLRTQINTLGPAPAEGETEPVVISETRLELTRQLEEAQAPVKAAELALARANALINQIDSTLRARQTDALFALGPTPLNPALWGKAAEELLTTFNLSWAGVTSSWQTETQRAELRKNLPAALVLAVLALVLLVRGRIWVMRVGVKMRERGSGATLDVWSFILSLGQVLLPFFGLVALMEALRLTGALGLRAQLVADTLPGAGLLFFTARWIGNRVFGQPGADWQVFDLTPARRTEARLYSATLGFLLGLYAVLQRVMEYESYSDGSRAVLLFPVLGAVAFLQFRLGQILRRHAREVTGEGEEGGGFLARSAGFVGLLLKIVGVLGPVAVAIGYTGLGDRMLIPTVMSLGLIGVVLALHHFFVDLYALVVRADQAQAQEALVPVLASFVVALLAIPVLALFWGARVTDLTELWTTIGQGVTIGDTVIALSDLITFAIVFAIGYAATRLVQGTLKSTVLPKTRLDIGGQNAISSGIGYVGIFVAALVAITSAGINLSAFAIVAGALSVGIGFGLQNIVSNFVSGIILLIERPISKGDWIEVGGQMGFVRDISVRSTRIETFDRTDVILPNSDLISGVVTNYTRGNSVGRVIVPVGVAYGTDTKKVEDILREIANNHPLVTVNPPPSVFFMEFGADSLNFEIRAILRDVNFKLAVHSEMNHEIARRFAEEGIEIPFAQRDIWLRNPEVLAGAVAPPPAAPKPKARRKPAARPDETDTAAARAQLDVEDMQDTHGYGKEDSEDD